jgi:putative ABC transport system permease protein
MRPEHVGTGRLVLGDSSFRGAGARVREAIFLQTVVDRLQAAPGVQSAAAVSTLPMEPAGGIALKVTPEDAPNDDARAASGAYLMATPGYFKVMGVALRGEDLPAFADSSRPVAVINQTMAAKLWPGQNPIGRRLALADSRRTVIGVVADIRTRTLDKPADGQMYWPMAEVPQPYEAIVARGTLDSPLLLDEIRDAVHAVNPKQPVYALRTMDDVIDATVAPRRTNTVLLTVFGLAALLLAGVGVYAVLSYNVTQRTREIGVRVALGAQRADVIRLVMGQGIALAVTGIALGLAGAYALSRLLSSILYGVSPHAITVFAAAPATLAAIAILATLVPSLRATRVDAMTALRHE